MNATGPSAGSPTGPPASVNPVESLTGTRQTAGMLSIDQRSTVERFARLEDFAIPVFTDRGGIEAQHARERQSPMRCGPTRHSHPPVRDDEFVAAARSALVIELREHHPVLHELPAWPHVHLHVFVLGRGVV
jgi:hypothetical protein